MTIIFTLKQAITGHGASRTDTFTVRKNMTDTILTTSLTGGNVSALLNTVSVTYNQGDDLSLKAVRSTGSGTSDVVVILDIY